MPCCITFGAPHVASLLRMTAFRNDSVFCLRTPETGVPTVSYAALCVVGASCARPRAVEDRPYSVILHIVSDMRDIPSTPWLPLSRKLSSPLSRLCRQLSQRESQGNRRPIYGGSKPPPCDYTSSDTAAPCHLPLKGKAFSFVAHLFLCHTISNFARLLIEFNNAF